MNLAKPLTIATLAGTALLAAYLLGPGASAPRTTDSPAADSAASAAAAAEVTPVGEIASEDSGPGIQILTRAQAQALGYIIPPPPAAPPAGAEFESAAEEGLPADLRTLDPDMRDQEIVDLAPFADMISEPPSEPGTFPEPTECDADFNGSGDSDATDLVTFVDRWFALDPETAERMDHNDSGEVDREDLSLFLQAWLSGC